MNTNYGNTTNGMINQTFSEDIDIQDMWYSQIKKHSTAAQRVQPRLGKKTHE